MAPTTRIRFNAALCPTDPQDHPALLIGQLRHLVTLPFEAVRSKLDPRVSPETWLRAVASLHPAPTDFCPLYLNVATVAALPVNVSRHNTTSRAHAISRLVRTHSFSVAESIVLVCERRDVFASGCAVARAFPLYSRKSGQPRPPASGSGDAQPSSAGPPPEVLVSVEFILMDEAGSPCTGDDARLTADELQLLHDAARSIRLAARIVDAPCNEMDVDAFVRETELVRDRLQADGFAGVRLEVLRSTELLERGFGGLHGVGRAAESGPALAVLSFRPEPEQPTSGECVAWVGKGIMYDTGGLSIKGKTAMPGMKRDCGGAAAILGAFDAAVRAGFTQPLHAVLCLAENAVGPSATRPDDVHRLYSGRTVEINNTDAEGRLVLADGVAFARHDLNATVIVDVATLTGAQGVATGKYHGALLANAERWEGRALEAGRTSGDLLAPLVYCPELHFSEFASTVADMKNSVADRGNALASCAGLFVGANLGFDYTGVWLHVDMASPVHSGERATGYGVALLCTLFGRYTRNAMLRSIGPELDDAGK